MSQRHRVLVVDDSAFARKVVRELLERSGWFEVVGIARDGLEALEAIAELAPDVVTLDLVMPQLDGLGVLNALGDRAPPIVLVTVSGAETQMGAEALLKGAVDIVQKPSALATERLYEIGDELVAKVLAAVTARPRSEEPPALFPAAAASDSRFRLIAIGASTGGPRAISAVLTSLPAGLPVPVVAGIHIPEGYTKTLAERIAAGAHIPIVEGTDGMHLEPGSAVIVPGGFQSEVVGTLDRLRLVISKARAPHRHFAPSLDLLFESAARSASPVLGVVLTGMGDDATEGARAIRAAGGEVVTESERSSVVYGMPRAVTEAGQSDASLDLEQIAAWLVERLGSHP